MQNDEEKRLDKEFFAALERTNVPAENKAGAKLMWNQMSLYDKKVYILGVMSGVEDTENTNSVAEQTKQSNSLHDGGDGGS